MNTLFLIGNGFDINLGLPTKYHDFYKYYLALPQDKDSSAVANLKTHLKACLSSENDYWSDLEIALGKYTQSLSTFRELETAYDSINDHLKDYIVKVEAEQIPKLDINPEIFKHHLRNIDSYVTRAERTVIHSMYHRYGGTNDISIINFNYTNSIEYIIENLSLPLNIGKSPYLSSASSFLKQILHIHGTTKNPILGINDASQIANDRLRKLTEVQEYLIKTRINSTLGHYLDRDAKLLIEEAHLIGIYGMSLGKTDTYWWELIGKALSNGRIVIYFVHDPDNADIPPRKLANYNRNKKREFLQATNLNPTAFDSLENNIIIVPNSPIFNLSPDAN